MKLLRPSTNPSVIGEYGQLVYDYSKNKEDRLLINDFLNSRGFGGKEFFPLTMTPKAKITDLMTSSLAITPVQLIVSNKLLRLFQKYEGQQYEVGTVGIRHGSENFDYYLIGRTDRISEDVIDLERSRTAVYKWEVDVYLPDVFTTIEEFKKTEDAVFVSVTFNESILGKSHHFVCPVINMMFVSDELAKDIAEAEITGVNLFEFDYSSDISQQGLYQLPIFYAG